MEPKAIPATQLGSEGPGTTAEPLPLATPRTPAFSSIERCVLDALGDAASVTTGQLRFRTGLTPEELASALDSLRARGVVTRLNTVVESYRSRFPGVSLDPG